MKKILRNILSALPLLIGFIAIDPAIAQQKTDYSPLVKLGYSGYKDFYNPNANVTYENNNALLGTTHDGLALEKIKFFIPPGTKGFGVGYLTYNTPQESKAVAKFKELPVHTIEAVTADTMVTNPSDTLKRLVSDKEELNFYSPGGSGTLTVSRYYQNDNFEVKEGGYIYLHLLSVPGGRVYSLQTRITVDEACYRSWYDHAQWDAQGNPDENATHTCAGSAGGGTVTSPVLTGLELSPSTWNATTNINDTNITVTPLPKNTTLPTCMSSDTTVLMSGSAAGQFVINPTAVTTATTVTITCGSKSASLSLVPPAAGPVVQITKQASTTDIDGNLVLNVTLDRPATDIVGKTKTSFWVAARIPKNGFFFTEDEWFFLDLNGWKQLLLPNPELVAYKINQTPAKLTPLKIPVGLSKNILDEYNVDIHFGYKDAEGSFKDMGIIWKKE